MEKKGLTTQEALVRLEQHGPNAIPEEKPRSKILIFIDQLKNPLIYVLLFAAVVTVFLRDFKDTIVIAFAVFINTILGFIQENKAQKALLALKKIITPKTRVLRDGKITEIPARNLVAGDIVILEAGYKIPADGEIIQGAELAVNEAILTGESVPVEKSAKAGKNEVFMGTTILTGRGQMEVLSVGLGTRIGQIASLLSNIKEEKTPLQKRLTRLAKNLAILVLVLSLIIFALGFLAGKGISEMFLTSVALAVAAIPEGLVVALTAILAIGMQRIFKRKALVRKLLAAETLGSATVICTDKTGTLTEGKFKVVNWEVNNKEVALKLAILCNSLADPQELALWEFAQSQNHTDPQRESEKSPLLFELPFSSERMFMATVNRIQNSEFRIQKNMLFVKGAPEKILTMSAVGMEEKKRWERKIEEWTSHGIRILGMAYKEVKSPKLKEEGDLNNLNFLGLVGFADPVRKEVHESLSVCQEAGIKIKVLTGDYRLTAEAVLEDLGIKVKSGEVLEGQELAHLAPEELRERVLGVKLFARINPSQKLQIVQALQENGEVVALIGDGVNDAPALQKADIGVVVGEASEVAKETADMVLLDSNFQTIVAAIEEGRGIFINLQKVITYLLSDVFAAIGLVTGTIIFGLPLPLSASQILWINLISDGFPGLALTFDPREKDLMSFPPRKPEESILNRQIKTIVGVVSVFTAFVALTLFVNFLKARDLQYAQSLVFALFGLATLFYVFSCRSLEKSILKTNPFGNLYLILAVLGGLLLVLLPFWIPGLGQFLGIVALETRDWGIVLAGALAVILLVEMTKGFFNYLAKQDEKQNPT